MRPIYLGTPYVLQQSHFNPRTKINVWIALAPPVYEANREAAAAVQKRKETVVTTLSTA